MSRTGRVAAVGVALLAAAVAALLVPTLWLRPYSVDHFYTRLFVQFAWRRPLLLSQLQILEPLGLRFHNDELNDLSVEFQRAEADWVDRQLALLRRYDRRRLEPAERVTYDTVEWFLEDVARGRPWMLHDYPMNQFTGVQSSLPEFMLTGHRIDDLGGARAYVARLRRFEEAFSQLRAGLELRRERGIVAPPFVLRLVQREIRDFIAVEPEEHPLYLRLAAALDRLDPPAAERRSLLAELRRVLAEQVFPAYRLLIAALEELENAGGGVGAWTLPDGEAFYDYALDHHATADVSAEELHLQGLAEVARIEGQIRGALDGLGLRGDEPAAEIHRLAREERFIYPDDEAGHRQMLADYREILGEIGGRLAPLFERPPPVGVEVRAVPEGEELGSPAAYYRPPPVGDESRPGTFFVNLRESGRVPRFAMRTLAYHEAIPGHHCQTTLADAARGAPLLRRLLPLTAFVEGWALYAETLAAEHGLLDDPYDRLGHLQAELFRAVRLVVDTGIHHRRWDRRRAVEYMTRTTGMPRSEVLVEVERQIVNPGRACAYKIGQLKLLELRRRARRRLGGGFDLRRFHTTVLEHGAVPLEMLESVVESWIESELRGSRAEGVR